MSKPRLFLVRCKRDLVVRAKEGDRIVSSYEVGRRAGLEKRVVAVCVTVTMPSLLPRLEDICRGGGEDSDWDAGGGGSGDGSRRKSGDVFEDVLGVEEFGVDVLGGEESGADHENFCGDVTTGGKKLECGW